MQKLGADIRRDVYGLTTTGGYGLPYQMDVMDAHGLKAVFFLEGLFACETGPEPLREIVSMVRSRGHEVQLHIHTEWLQWIEPSILPGRFGNNVKDFSEDEQVLLIGRALENLKGAGAPDVSAFRAGNYGANLDTLRALAQLGLRYDTSHNTTYLDTDCGLQTGRPEFQPRVIEGVWEFPVTYFSDWPGHYRHAQVCACSTRELQRTMLQAWQRGWYSFVLVSHSFEMLRRRKQGGVTALADRTVIRRFEALCRFLGENRDKFRTSGFSDVDPAAIPATGPAAPLHSTVHQTARRMAEQLMRRLS